MLTPQEEAHELASEPLPIIICPSDEFLPTQIQHADELIAVQRDALKAEQEYLQKLLADRKELVERALKLVRMEDNRYRIVPVPVYPRNVVMVDLLRTSYPNEYATICKLQADELEEAKRHVGESVGIGELKAVIKDKSRQMILIKPNGEPTYEYTIVQKV